MGIFLHRSGKQTCSDKTDLSDRTAMKRAASAIVNTASGLLGVSDSDSIRSERALNELTSMVYQAIDAFQKEYEE